MGLLDKLASGMAQAQAADNGAELADGTELYMKQKLFSLNDKFNICDANEQPVYEVKGNITGLNFKMNTASGEAVAEIKKKIIALTPSYEISFKSGRKASLKKKMALLKEEFNGNVDGKELQIKGDVSAYSFDVLVGGEKVGAVAKKFLAWGDTYAISFVDDSWKEIMVALVVTVDNACHSSSND